MTDYTAREVSRIEEHMRRIIARRGQFPVTFRITKRDRERLDRLMQHYRALGLDPSVTTIFRCALVALDKELGFTLAANDAAKELAAKHQTVAAARGEV